MIYSTKESRAESLLRKIRNSAKEINEAVEKLEKAQLSKESTTSDLISRQAAIDALKEHRVLYCDDTPETFSKLSYVEKSRVDELDTAISTLVNLPSVQLEPHEGHWIEGGIYRDVIECNCSECGQLMTTAATVRMNFCPNCGAKMTISTK